jgi:signal transduction histidine kinase
MRSVVFKLILTMAAVSLLSVTLVSLVSGSLTAREFEGFVFNQNTQTLLEYYQSYYSTHGEWTGVGGPFQGMFPGRAGGEHGPGPMVLVDASNQVVHPGLGYELGQEVLAEDLKGSIPVEVDGEIVGALLARRSAFDPTNEEARFIERIARGFAINAVIVIAVAVLLGVVLTRSITGPLRELTTATRAVAQGDLDQRVRVRSGDEVGELAAAFNQMSAELARAQKSRRQMTADIAHELRTPISIILGHADAVHEGALPASRETFDIIREETTRLERLVEDLRTLSRADAGELTLMPSRQSAHKLLERAVTAHMPHAQEKGVELRVVPGEGDSEINVDRDRMLQVLDNLLANGLRYTPTGGQVTLGWLTRLDVIEIRVTDTGPGMSEEERARVFDRFYRADPSRQRDGGGSGLGLAIAKSIVESHGGRIWVESELGSGATFVIQLPLSGETA